MKYGVGITAVETEDSTILIRINEAIIFQFKSIIAVNQVRHWGHIVDDIPIKYGGRQSIFIEDGPTIPFSYKVGLMWLRLRRPTKKEINEAQIFDLTDFRTWDPMEENDGNEL